MWAPFDLTPDVVVFMFRGRCCGVFVVYGFGLSQRLVIICRLLAAGINRNIQEKINYPKARIFLVIS